MNKQKIELLGYVKASSYRQKVLKSIYSDLKTPSEIESETQIRINHVSNILIQLKEKELVECLNEEAKKGRLYQTTELGNKISKYLK